MAGTRACWIALSSATAGLAGCATAGPEAAQVSTVPETDNGESQQVALATLAEAPAVRDNASAPILAVMTVGKVVYPYVYGYPLHPDGDAASGVAQLRRDNATGARESDTRDRDGVMHAIEELPQLGCRFDGIREPTQKYVPVSLTCELPAPKALGGTKRPVLGALSADAKAEQILRDPTVQENFMGEFHLKSDDFSSGSGIGYFNTTHGQLALVFSQKKLTRFVYYFDPGVTDWQNPAHWVGL